MLRVEDIKLNDRNGDIKKRWYIDMYLCLGSGQRKRKPFYISSKKYPHKTSRVEYAKSILRQLKSTTPKEKSFRIFHKPNWGVQLKDITAYKIKESDSKRSQQTYRSDLNIFLEFMDKNSLREMKVTDFSSSHAHLFFDYLLFDRGIANMTRNNLIIRISALFNKIIERTSLIQDNPFKGIKQLKVATYFQHVAFTKEDQELVEGYMLANNAQLYFFSRFMYYCFTRVDETMKLRVKDIDVKKRILTIESVVNKTSIRLNKVIPIKLWNMILESGILELPSDYYIFGRLLKSGLEPCSTNYPANKCRTILKKLGLYQPNYYSLYSFRHTGIDRIIEHNTDVDIVDLQNHIGHRKIETTMNYTKARKLRINRKLEDRDW